MLRFDTMQPAGGAPRPVSVPAPSVPGVVWEAWADGEFVCRVVCRVGADPAAGLPAEEGEDWSYRPGQAPVHPMECPTANGEPELGCWCNRCPTRDRRAPAAGVLPDPALDGFGPPVHVYTRAQAIADRVLVDVVSAAGLRDGIDLSDVEVARVLDVTRQHYPGAVPGSVVWSAGVAELLARAATNRRALNDWPGLWHDVAYMARPAQGRIRSALERGQASASSDYQLVIRGAGRQRLYTLRLHVGPPCPSIHPTRPLVTYLLPGED